jgi:clan AA aspartic protease (TIGR02281 family)
MALWKMVLTWLMIFGAMYWVVVTFVPGMGTPKIRLDAQGNLDLRADRSGNYLVPGSINGVPVTFLVDTGASTVSVSSEMAKQMGLVGCMPTNSSTANGAVSHCTSAARTVTFGNFEALNVQVGVLPNLGSHALLGMNVLRAMNLSQKDGRLVISKSGD